MTDAPFSNLLSGQKALITGGTNGIGLAIALAFARQGADIALFAMDRERGERALTVIASQVPSVTTRFYSVDVSQTKAVDQAMQSVLADFGSLDILVNNAGVTRDQLLMKMSEEAWDCVMDVNVKSCFNVSRAVIRPMMKARKGSIINISSVVGITGNSGQVNYAASKGAINSFTYSLAKEVASRNIRVNCIAPGFIATAMTEVLSDLQKAGILARIPMGRMGEPSEVANMALFLASPLASYITGQLFTVDGGMT